MTQQCLVFTVRIFEDCSKQGRWISPAFELPGAKLTGFTDAAGSNFTGASLVDGAILLAADGGKLAAATLEVPGDLTLQSTLDQAKFELEREKIIIEESNRKRTLQWSVGSAVLAAAVTLTVAYINKSGLAKPAAVSGPSVDAVEACRASLQRLPLLAASNGQSVTSLAEAIRRHQADCEEVLVKVLGMR